MMTSARTAFVVCWFLEMKLITMKKNPLGDTNILNKISYWNPLSSDSVLEAFSNHNVAQELCDFQSTSELYRVSNRRWSANFSANFCGQKVVAWSARPFPTAVNLGSLDRSRYFFFHVVPHLSSRGWVDRDLDPLLLRKSGSAGNRTRVLWAWSHELLPLDHRGCSFTPVHPRLHDKKFKDMHNHSKGPIHKLGTTVLEPKMVLLYFCNNTI
jgi:hypothetical protein